MRHSQWACKETTEQMVIDRVVSRCMIDIGTTAFLDTALRGAAIALFLVVAVAVLRQGRARHLIPRRFRNRRAFFS